MTLITVIVCTYNRAYLLKKALHSLFNQTLQPSAFEIIIVDNNSTDNTVQIFQQLQTKYTDYNIQLIFETQQGLGYSRNTGFKHANGRYIAFMDDDALASEDWLKTALQIFDQIQPKPLCIGGPIFPYYDSPKPEWFQDEYEIRTLGERPRFPRPGERSFSGSNMIFRKEILEIYGGFNVDLGVRGEYLALGEERSLFLRIWKAEKDATFYYSPKLIVFHLVPEYKMTPSYRLKRKYASGVSSYKLHSNVSISKRIRLPVEVLYHIAKAFTQAIFHGDTYLCFEDWAIKTLTPVAIRLGRLVASLGFSVSIRQR